MAALLLNRCNPIGRDAQQGITVSTLVTASEGARFLSNRRLQIALALDGNPDADGAAGTKFGRFVEAVRQHSSVDLVGVGDSTLRGPAKAFAIAAAWRRDRRQWKEHYRKNPLTFRLRSLQTRRWIDGLDRSPDIILQVAALSRPSPPTGLPYALYLDFTFALTEREWPERGSNGAHRVAVLASA